MTGEMKLCWCPEICVRSLYVLGASVFSHGYVYRPPYPAQRQVQAALETYLILHRGPAFEALPTVPVDMDTALWQQVAAETRGIWSHRAERARAARRKQKRWKQQMQGQSQLRFA